MKIWPNLRERMKDVGLMRAASSTSLLFKAFDGPLRGKDHFRIRTLVNLRWLAIGGQTGLVLLIAYAFKFDIRLSLCLGIITASIWLNLMLILSARQRSHFKDWESGLQLSFDTLQLALLLGVTGGLNNPFCLMLIAPATVAAANLPLRAALGVIFAAIFAAIALYLWWLPLPWTQGAGFEFPPLYRFGMLSAVLIGIVFTAGYAWQTALEATRMEQALNATRAVLENEHRLSALGGLAAAAAHELGTPLGTIQVVAREMLRALSPQDPLYPDVELLLSQSQRCRDILKNLAQKPDTRDCHYDQMRLSDFIEEAVMPLRQPLKTHNIEVMLNDGVSEREASRLITIRRKPEWIYALSALIENATDFAQTCIWIKVHIHKLHISLSVEDDGPGFAADILPRLGEPYISSRNYDDGGMQLGHSHSGMGLGFFIAKTLCEHSGAVVSFGNRAEGGAYVKALWRRDHIDLWSQPAA
jgi:two-component system, sensor histidine kinase RegB